MRGCFRWLNHARFLMYWRSRPVTPLATGSGSGRNPGKRWLTVGTGKIPFSTTDLNNGDPEIKKRTWSPLDTSIQHMKTYVILICHKYTTWKCRGHYHRNRRWADDGTNIPHENGGSRFHKKQPKPFFLKKTGSEQNRHFQTRTSNTRIAIKHSILATFTAFSNHSVTPMYPGIL